ncbi:MAG: hypothetical protein KDE53_36005 [Caldilineaceae bacterium]|nr:hypothetical protein [Caldilineaceae bacterium]MCB0127165.1 hypothetical protein [Caldilineaceae bacterium]
MAQSRGVWPYDGEIDNGFVGALRTAAVVVIDDPIFGLLAYGGELIAGHQTLQIVPKDGVRQRLHLLEATPHLHLSLNRDGFAATGTIRLQRHPFRLQFDLENRTLLQPHTTLLRIDGLPAGVYAVWIDGALQGSQQSPIFELAVGVEPGYTIVIELKSV